ncbi:MAG: hypothetical protein V1725_06790 [archaeon]
MKKLLLPLLGLAALLGGCACKEPQQQVREYTPEDVKPIPIDSMMAASVPFEAIPLEQHILQEEERVKTIAEEDYLQTMEDISTPLEAAIYCTKVLHYAAEENFPSNEYGLPTYFVDFKTIHEKKEDVCTGGATAAAALLYDNGFHPYVLIMRAKNSDKSHVVFVYKSTDGWYGSIGINEIDIRTFADSLGQIAQDIIWLGEQTYPASYKLYELNGPGFIDEHKNHDPRMDYKTRDILEHYAQARLRGVHP